MRRPFCLLTRCFHASFLWCITRCRAGVEPAFGLEASASQATHPQKKSPEAKAMHPPEDSSVRRENPKPKAHTARATHADAAIKTPGREMNRIKPALGAISKAKGSNVPTAGIMTMTQTVIRAEISASVSAQALGEERNAARYPCSSKDKRRMWRPRSARRASAPSVAVAANAISIGVTVMIDPVRKLEICKGKGANHFERK